MTVMMKEILKGLWRYKSTLLFLLTPLLLLPLPLVVAGKESACGYCMILMAIYWVSEIIPMAVTSLIPLVFFPLMGIMKADDVSRAFFSDTTWLFVGGLFLAVAVETTKLHKRISLRVLTLVGAKPHNLMFGFMITTFFLSMWISNTSTTAMMLPVVEAVVRELLDEKKNVMTQLSREFISSELETSSAHQDKSNSKDNDKKDLECNKQEELDSPKQEKQERGNAALQKWQVDLQKGLTICVPYASSIGGTATVTGTGPNLVLSGQFSELFPDADKPLSFANWIGYCLPSALVFLIFAYFWLSWFYLGFRSSISNIVACFKRKKPTKEQMNVQDLLRKEYDKLGPITWAEGTTLVIFATTVLLWFFREPDFMPGWSEWFEDDFISDGTVSMAMASLLFFLPTERPQLLTRQSHILKQAKPVQPILKWKSASNMFPWGIVFLLGGGFALAQGATESGLSQWLADQLTFLEGIEPWLICLIVTIMLCAFTEFTSNVATATLFVPILASLAQSLEIHPIYLLIPPILATSMAFMLPVATPPNAIAFSYSHLKVFDMVKAGALLNIIGIGIVTLFINTYGVVYFDLNQFPEWAKAPNATESQP